MSIDDDLEKAGARSRRQLTNPKHHSAYSSKDNSLLKQRSRLFKIKSSLKTNPKWTASIFCIIIFFFIILRSKPNSDNLSLFHKKPDDIIIKEPVTFKDSSQFTDYNRISSLLTKKKNLKTNSFPSRFQHIKDAKSSFLHQLSTGTVLGHTFDELRRLTNGIALPGMNGKHKRVPVTAIIHTTAITQLYVQVQAVLTQTAQPEHIWIVCSTETKFEVETRIMTLDRRRVRVLAMDDESHQGWLKSMAYVATDFVWLVDQSVAPGKRYLENILKLSSTAYYHSSLLGTEAASLQLGSRPTVDCLPDMAVTGAHMKTQAVDMINDSWLLNRAWIPNLLEAVEKQKYLAAKTKEASLDFSTGLFISRTLYMTMGIPSIVIPTDPIERAYWGDVRLQKNQKSDSCRALEEGIQDLNLKGQLLSQDILYRGSTLIPNIDIDIEPVLFFVNSLEEFEHLAPLLCGFESQEYIDLHLVTSGFSRGASGHDLKQLLPSQCDVDARFAMNVIIHDISVLKESAPSNLANVLFHRLTRILTVTQPKVMIHNIQKENNVFYTTTVKTSLDIVQVPEIYLPTEDIPHFQWITQLSPQVLSNWNAFSIKLMVMTSKKTQDLRRFLTSASSAHYGGDTVDLSIFMDYTSDGPIQTLANQFEWKQGKKYIRHRISATPKPSLFVESWYPSSNHEYAILLNDDLELSPFYYSWAKYAILKYRYEEVDLHLFGVSLYAPRVIETDPTGRKLLETASTEPYLMQWPSYAALYFPEHWREFHDYITARQADRHTFDLQRIQVPHLRSSHWNSWRRYAEELIYLRSYLMLFPPQSFSTLHLQLKKKKAQEEFGQALSLYQVPLSPEPVQSLASLQDLKVLDLWAKQTSIERLEQRGSEFQESISSCVPDEQFSFDPTDLLCPFARVVKVRLENEHDPLPQLAVKEMNVYT